MSIGRKSGQKNGVVYELLFAPIRRVGTGGVRPDTPNTKEYPPTPPRSLCQRRSQPGTYTYKEHHSYLVPYSVQKPTTFSKATYISFPGVGRS